jgi:hypothetical protein
MVGTTSDNAGLDLQERFEATGWGRRLVNVFIVATVVSIGVWNLPDSQLKADLTPSVRRYLTTAGLDQNWAVFAPDPRRVVVQLRAQLTYEDGTSEEIVGAPEGDAVIGAYRFYRWSKWVEYVRTDDHQDLWKPAAIYLARENLRNGRLPVSVTLIRRWYEVPPPGPFSDVHPPWQQFAYYTLTITPQGRS